MRVFLASDSRKFAGTERHMVDLGLALLSQGCQVAVVCPFGGALADSARLAGLKVLPWMGEGILPGAGVLRLSKLLRREKPDVVHCHNGRTSLMATLAQFFTRSFKVVLTQHFIDPAHVHSRWGVRWLKHRAHVWVNARASRMISISQAVFDAVLARGQMAPSKLCKVLNGISTPVVGKPGTRAGKQTGAWGGQGVRMACVARLDAEKGHSVLIGALALLARRATEESWHCSLVGEGTLQASLESSVTETGLGDRVSFLGFRSDVGALMNELDVLVLPAPAEPFGLVLLEAMALGKPVVAMAAGGPQEIVEHGKTGLLVPPGDSQALADALQQLIADRALRERFGVAGRERYLNQFTAERMARETLAVYEAALADCAEPPGQAIAC